MELLGYFAVYHLLLLPVDAAAIYYVWRRGTFRSCLLVAVALALISLAISFMLPTESYLALRLTCHGWFFHLPTLLMASAWLLRKRHPLLSKFCVAGGFLLLAIVVDAFWIEPYWLRETRYELASSKITKPIRIGVLADIQTDNVGTYEKKAIERMVAAKPDVILLAGDYIQIHDREEREAAHAELNRVFREAGLFAPQGVYAVQGNNDHGNWTSVFDGLPGSYVFEGSDTTHNEGIQVTGLSTRDSFHTRFRAEIDTQGRYHIVVGHAPDFAMGEVNADLLIAGHTHGGQVQLPFFGPIITMSRVPRSWTQGQTDLPNGQTLIVSRGIGMERSFAPRVRFLCRPEIVIVDVLPK